MYQSYADMWRPFEGMKTSFVFQPENDVIPATPSEEKYKTEQYESTLFELSSPFNPEHPNSRFWLRCFKCGIVANLGLHEVHLSHFDEETQPLITISPSILCPRQSCGNHYYIKNNEIIQA